MSGALGPLGVRNVVLVLLDSLNRWTLGTYGGTECRTPNLDRLASRSLRFDRHYAASLPCIPARHDLLCGTWDFLWRPWGSMEIWDTSLTARLREDGVVTKLVTDHPHLFEVGGENYHADFTAWEYLRGHESDAWRTRPDPSWVGAPSFGRGWMPYDNSRGWFRGEADFPGPRTMAAAATWLEEEAAAAERFLLVIDEFDPHEPFDVPQPYASMYDPDWEGAHLIWPPYAIDAIAGGVIDQRQAQQLRAQYMGKVTMIDHWLGRLLDAMDRRRLWDDTVLILLTDHGHYLGEQDLFGKPGHPLRDTMWHIPMLVASPNMPPRTVSALTTTVDVFATVLDLFGATPAPQSHGRSLLPVIREDKPSVRDWVLAGVWGREVHVTDGRLAYARAPAAANEPLSLWSNRWSTLPVGRGNPRFKLPPPDDRAYLDRMPGSQIPVLRQPFRDGDMLPFWANGGFRGSRLYDLQDDPGEVHDLAGTANEARAAGLLAEALTAVGAPADQFIRLGLDQAAGRSRI